MPLLEKSKVLEYPQLSSLTYYFGNGMFSVKSVGRLAGMEIIFKGVVEINPQVPEGWNLRFAKKNVLLIWAETYIEITSLVFAYQGELDISHVVGVGWHGNKIYATRNNNYISYWNAIASKWDNAGAWVNYKYGYKIGKRVSKSAIITPLPIEQEDYIVEGEGGEGVSPVYGGGGGGY